jgi:hypothetical protein
VPVGSDIQVWSPQVSSPRILGVSHDSGGMTESPIKINGFPPIILADSAVAKGDTPRRKPLI